MIRSKDLNSELNTLETKVKEGNVSSTDVVKALCLIAKVLRDIKANTVTMMNHYKIPLVERREEKG